MKHTIIQDYPLSYITFRNTNESSISNFEDHFMN